MLDATLLQLVDTHRRHTSNLMADLHHCKIGPDLPDRDRLPRFRSCSLQLAQMDPFQTLLCD